MAAAAAARARGSTRASPRTAAAGTVAAIDVGTNPTFGVEPLHVESFLLDFEGDLPGEPLAVEFWARLRDEVRYDSVDALVTAIGEDVERTLELIPDDALG